MSDEEKKAIDELKEEINKPLEVPEDKFDTFILFNIEKAKVVLDLIKKQQKEIEELEKIICTVRNLSYGVICYDEINGKKYLSPRKNFTKQELYKNHLKIQLLLKSNFIFLNNEDFIKELKGGE